MSLAIDAKSAKARASIAANMIKKNKHFYRAFDDCFEMGDGDEVINYLIVRAAKDPILALNIKNKIPLFGAGVGDFNERLHRAIDQALSKYVELPDGYNRHTALFYPEPIETDGNLVKLRCAEPGKEYVTRWARKADLAI